MKGIIMKKSTKETYDSSYFLAVKSQKKDKKWLKEAWEITEPIKRLRHIGK